MLTPQPLVRAMHDGKTFQQYLLPSPVFVMTPLLAMSSFPCPICQTGLPDIDKDQNLSWAWRWAQKCHKVTLTEATSTVKIIRLKSTHGLSSMFPLGPGSLAPSYFPSMPHHWANHRVLSPQEHQQLLSRSECGSVRVLAVIKMDKGVVSALGKSSISSI